MAPCLLPVRHHFTLYILGLFLPFPWFTSWTKVIFQKNQSFTGSVGCLWKNVPWSNRENHRLISKSSMEVSTYHIVKSSRIQFSGDCLLQRLLATCPSRYSGNTVLSTWIKSFLFYKFFSSPFFNLQALGMEVAKTGVAAALPFLLSAIVKVLAGQISDRIGFISERGKVILFASVSQVSFISKPIYWYICTVFSIWWPLAFLCLPSCQSLIWWMPLWCRLVSLEPRFLAV